MPKCRGSHALRKVSVEEQRPLTFCECVVTALFPVNCFVGCVEETLYCAPSELHPRRRLISEFSEGPCYEKRRKRFSIALAANQFHVNDEEQQLIVPPETGFRRKLLYRLLLGFFYSGKVDS